MIGTSAIGAYGRRTFASLEVPNFRLYVAGQGISACGSWMQSVAMGLLVIHLTGSGTALGLVLALQQSPILFLGPYGGVIADRFPKRRILYVTQTALGLVSLLLGLLILTDAIRLWMVFTIGVLYGLISVFDRPAQQTFVREMVGPDHLANAVLLYATEMNVARVIGPAIAGVLAATVGLGMCFVVDGLSFFIVIFMLTRMRADLLRPAPRVAQARGQLVAGLKYIWSVPILVTLLSMLALVGMLTYEFSVVLPMLSEFALGSGASGYAALTAAMGFGSVVGGLYTAGRKTGGIRRLTVVAACFGLAVWSVAISPSLPFAVAGMVVVGFFSINFTSLGNVALQRESKPEMHGRVMSLYSMAFFGTTPIGAPLQGFIGEHAGPRVSLFIGGAAALVAALLGLRATRLASRSVVAEGREEPPAG